MISLQNITDPAKQNGNAAGQGATKDAAIFGKSLKGGKPMKSKKAEYLEDKNKKSAYVMLGLSLVILVSYSSLFFYSNVSAYLKAPSEISRVQRELAEYQSTIVPSLEKTRDLHKSAYDEEFDETLLALQSVFPEGVDKLGIVRLFESFAAEVAASFPPFEFTSINLGNPEKKDGYMVIPVSTSIHSSLAGFDRFLSLVDRSGYIYSGEGEDKSLIERPIRLMSISNISVKYRGVDEATGKDQGVDFSVKLNVYSRPSDQN